MRSILTMLAVSALALLVLACQNSTPPVTTETAKTNTNAGKTAPQTDEHGHEDNAQRISLADAKKEFDAGTAVFVDTRNDASFNQERIQGAINVPVELVDARFKEIPTDKKIIAYCSWPNEHSSAGLVTKLKQKGLANGYALVGGTNAWKTAGYPMDKGEKK